MAKKKLSESVSPLFEKVELLTKGQKLAICITAFAVLIGAFVGFSYWGKYDQIGLLKKKLDDEKRKLETAQKNARELDKYRKMMADAREEFELVRQALPEKEEIPSLLAGISQTGKEAGLDFLLFQPNPEVKKDFYAEIPVAINVTGGYHDVATFFSNVANMSRIVNIDNILMKPQTDVTDLTTTCTAITYKFIESADTNEKKTDKRKK